MVAPHVSKTSAHARWLSLAVTTLVSVSTASCASSPVSSPKGEPTTRPNIVLIVADDMGYSDLGCFGSEIATPNIDSLARHGHVFADFHTAPTCSPTRAMLLSGVDHHLAGMGNMAEFVPGTTNQTGKPGYEGHLNAQVLSVAQILRDSGYHTYMAGKWHLGLTPEHSPLAAGFERSFVLLNGAANHYRPNTKRRKFWADDAFTEYPVGRYSTELYTDKLLEFLKADRDDDKPFFLFAAYTSPHWPLQAPPEFRDKYAGQYDAGYNELQARRFAALKKRGIIAADAVMPEPPDRKALLARPATKNLPRWDQLTPSQQRTEARKMELYAAMVDNLDHHVGRLIRHLKETGEYDNTLFVFFSDNGAAPSEFNRRPSGNYEQMGNVDSYIGYGPQWAHASTAAFRLCKGYATEGGTRTPMIVKLPGKQGVTAIHQDFTSVLDMAPTFLDAAGASYPGTYQDRALLPHQGTSLLPFLQRKSPHIHPATYTMGWELFGRYAVRSGNWKLTWVEKPIGSGQPELYDLGKDQGEADDLAETHPAEFQRMQDLWRSYERECGVVRPEWRPRKKR